MQNLDIPFPETEYNLMDKLKNFNLIYPIDHPLSQSIKIDMVIRALAFSDGEFSAFIKNEKKPQEMVPLTSKLFEVLYLRECALSRVTRSEWENNYGPTNIRHFLALTKDSSPDSYVKIISLMQPNYSLSLFNKRYKIDNDRKN